MGLPPRDYSYRCVVKWSDDLWCLSRASWADEKMLSISDLPGVNMTALRDQHRRAKGRLFQSDDLMDEDDVVRRHSLLDTDFAKEYWGAKSS